MLQKKSDGTALVIHGIDDDLGPRNADSFRQDLHSDLKADLVPVRKDLANPQFNDFDWFRKDDDALAVRRPAHGQSNYVTDPQN